MKPFLAILLAVLSIGIATANAGAAPVVAVPAIRRQVLAPGQTLTLAATATGTGSLSYQWFHDGEPVAGATDAAFERAAASYADSGYYFVDVTDQSGTTRSAACFVIVAPVSTRVVGFGSSFSGQTQAPANLTDAVAIAANGNRSMAIRRDGTVTIWGYDTEVLHAPPAGLTDVVAVALNEYRELALKSDGTVVVWPGESNNIPVGLNNVVAIAAANSRFLALRSDGTLAVWDYLGGPTILDPAEGLKVVGHPAMGFNHALAIQPNGSVVVWGISEWGQLNMPTGLADATAVGAGSGHSLVVKNTGEVVAWGYNLGGQTNVPDGLTGVMAVAGGGSHSLALQANGNIVAWGSDTYGETRVPDGLTGVFAVAAGNVHSLALREMAAGSLAITADPSDRYVFGPNTANFSISAVGTGGLSYQWQKWPAGGGGWINVADAGGYSGANTAALTIAVTDLGMSGDAFRCIVSDTTGSITSGTAGLTVFPAAPTISSHPVSRTVSVGGSTDFQAAAIGAPLPTYQWQRQVAGSGIWTDLADGGIYSGATTTKLSISAAAFTMNGDKFRLTASNYLGLAASGAGSLTVLPPPPVITTQPSPQRVIVGSPINLNVVATSLTSISYQWRKDGVNINGAIFSSYTVSSAQLSQGGNYTVVVSNTGGAVVSDVAVVNVGTRPSFTTNPYVSFAILGAQLELVAAASGTGPITYQWRKDGVDLAGATSATLVVPATQFSDGGTYSVVATNDFGTVSSYPAFVLVEAARQRAITLMQGSRAIGSFDLGTFNPTWQIAATADMNGDNKPDIIWQNITTGERYIWLMDGTVHYGDVNLGVVPTAWRIAAVVDMNGDHQPDIVWHNTVTGSLYVWLMDHGRYYGALDLGTVPLALRLEGAADFNADGQSDFLWEDRGTGERTVWLMTGAQHTGTLSLATLDPQWEVAVIADVNQDGRPDIVWQNRATGSVYAWYLNGVTRIGEGDFGPSAPQHALAAAADFNGDGRPDFVWQTRANKVIGSDFNRDGHPDIVWQNTVTGERYLWLMDGTTNIGAQPLGTLPPVWSLAATADFNGDGQPDLVWQNTATGERYIWFMDQWTHFGDASLGTVGPAWSMVAAVDFNGDSKPDILWQNTSTGGLYIWYMDGSVHYGDDDLGSVSTNLRVMGAADFDGDGKPDILIRDLVTGELSVRRMNGAAVLGTTVIDTVPLTETVEAVIDFDQDGHPDIVWQDTTTGWRHVWLMTGTMHTGDRSITAISTDWAIVR
jgi:hypothetical protein